MGRSLKERFWHMVEPRPTKSGRRRGEIYIERLSWGTHRLEAYEGYVRHVWREAGWSSIFFLLLFLMVLLPLVGVEFLKTAGVSETAQGILASAIIALMSVDLSWTWFRHELFRPFLEQMTEKRLLARIGTVKIDNESYLLTLLNLGAPSIVRRIYVILGATSQPKRLWWEGPFTIFCAAYTQIWKGNRVLGTEGYLRIQEATIRNGIKECMAKARTAPLAEWGLSLTELCVYVFVYDELAGEEELDELGRQGPVYEKEWFSDMATACSLGPLAGIVRFNSDLNQPIESLGSLEITGKKEKGGIITGATLTFEEPLVVQSPWEEIYRELVEIKKLLRSLVEKGGTKDNTSQEKAKG